MLHCVFELLLLYMMVAGDLVVSLSYEECSISGQNLTSGKTGPENIASSNIATGSSIPSTHLSVLSQQYCTVGNCTIVMKDTGQLLYIVDVISDVMIVKNNNTLPLYLMITMTNETSCSISPQQDSWPLFIFSCVVSCVIVVFTMIILVFHLLIVNLRRRITGKLIIINNVSLVVAIVDISVLSVVSYFNTSSWWLCRLLSYLSISFTVYEVSASLLLFHVGLLTYRSFKPLPELSTQLSKKLFIGYFTFLLVSTTPMLVCMIFSDLFSEGASLMFHPNGHCKQLFSVHHSVLVLMLVQLAIHKLFQITALFLVILYWYNMYCSKENDVISFKASRKYYLLLKAVVTTGATIGMVGYLFVASSLVPRGYSLLLVVAGNLSLLLQQGVMMMYLVCSKWVWKQLALSLFTRKQIECLFGV